MQRTRLPEHIAREKRFQLAGRHTATVSTMSEFGVLEEQHQAKIVDVSRTGVRLLIDEPLVCGQLLLVSFDLAESGVMLHMTADVRWCDTNDRGVSMAGCSLGPGFPEGFLAQLAAAGKIDRRTDDREPTGLSLSISMDPQLHWHPASLVNYSYGGLCLRSESPVTQPALCNVRIEYGETTMVTPIRLRWQLPEGAAYLFGCEFMKPGDSTRLQGLLDGISVEAATVRS